MQEYSSAYIIPRIFGFVKGSSQENAAGRANLETAVKPMIARGSTVGRANILSVVDGFCSTIELLAQYGCTVATPAGNVRSTQISPESLKNRRAKCNHSSGKVLQLSGKV